MKVVLCDNCKKLVKDERDHSFEVIIGIEKKRIGNTEGKQRVIKHTSFADTKTLKEFLIKSYNGNTDRVLALIKTEEL